MTPLKKLLIGSASAIAYGALVWTFSVTPPSGDGELTIVTTSDAEKSATLALVAPTVMWFRAVPSGLGADPVTLPALDYATTPQTSATNLIHDPAFNEVFYFWKITTHPAGFRAAYAPADDFNMPTVWNDRRIAYGQEVAFCFDEPGSYTLECFAVGPTGTTATQTTSFTIADPDTAYSGAATLCVNPAGDSDFSWAPAGSTNYSTGADDRAVVNTMLTDYRAGTTSRRILFKPGATFNMRGASLGAWNNSGDTRLRHYVGTPLGAAVAILDLGASGNGPRWQSNGDHASITLCNLDVRGPFDPSAGVPRDATDGVVGSLQNPAGQWQPTEGGPCTHHSVHRLKTSGFYMGVSFAASPAEYYTNGKGTPPFLGLSECVIEPSGADYGFFTNTFQLSSTVPIPINEPAAKMAWIGTKNVSPLTALEYADGGYFQDKGCLRYGFMGRTYFGCCDFYHIWPSQPLMRLHDGSGLTASTRAGWPYYNIDRFVGEGGVGLMNYATHSAGATPSETGSNPANFVIDKFLYIANSVSGHTFFGGRGGGDSAALGPCTIRNGLIVVPASGTGNRFISGADSGRMGSLNTHDLAHPRRIHNLTAVGLGTNSNLADVPEWFLSTWDDIYTDLTFENNIRHFPNQTRDVTSAAIQSAMTSGTLAGVTPRYPGRNDPQNPFVPASLASANIADNSTFDVTYAEINAINTRETGRAYTAATQAYWTSNPTHNMHFIRQRPGSAGPYYYVFNGQLEAEALSDRLRFTNRTGGTLTGEFQIWIDRRGLHPGPQASTATPTDMHLSWSPGSGSSAFPASGLQAFDTFLGTVRVGNTIPTGSGLTQATGADPKGAFGQA